MRLFPRSDCVHLWIPGPETNSVRAPWYCARCRRSRGDTIMLRVMAVCCAAGALLLAIVAATVIAVQIAIALSRH